jgi:hypothetical protein
MTRRRCAPLLSPAAPLATSALATSTLATSTLAHHLLTRLRPHPRRATAARHRSPIAPFLRHQVCLAKCMDRYLDAMALVSQTWAARAKQQAMAGQPGLGGGGFQ